MNCEQAIELHRDDLPALRELLRQAVRQGDLMCALLVNRRVQQMRCRPALAYYSGLEPRISEDERVDPFALAGIFNRSVRSYDYELAVEVLYWLAMLGMTPYSMLRFRYLRREELDYLRWKSPYALNCYGYIDLFICNALRHMRIGRGAQVYPAVDHSTGESLAGAASAFFEAGEDWNLSSVVGMYNYIWENRANIDLVCNPLWRWTFLKEDITAPGRPTHVFWDGFRWSWFNHAIDDFVYLPHDVEIQGVTVPIEGAVGVESTGSPETELYPAIATEEGRKLSPFLLAGGAAAAMLVVIAFSRLLRTP